MSFHMALTCHSSSADITPSIAYGRLTQNGVCRTDNTISSPPSALHPIAMPARTMPPKKNVCAGRSERM